MDAEALKIVADDLEYLANWGAEVSDGEIRRGSAVLRRLLVEDVYGAAWRAIGKQKQPTVIAVESKTVVEPYLSLSRSERLPPELFSKPFALPKTDGSGNARNNLRDMKKGDLAFFYHSNVGQEIVGIVSMGDIAMNTNRDGKIGKALDDETFKQMNDMDFPVGDVLDGIDAAAAVGLAPQAERDSAPAITALHVPIRIALEVVDIAAEGDLPDPGNGGRSRAEWSARVRGSLGTNLHGVERESEPGGCFERKYA